MLTAVLRIALLLLLLLLPATSYLAAPPPPSAVTGSSTVSYQGIDIQLGQPFRRVTMNELVQEKTGELSVWVGFWEGVGKRGSASWGHLVLFYGTH